jgi:hypothetical protein
MLGTSWLGEKLNASQKGLYVVVLIGQLIVTGWTCKQALICLGSKIFREANSRVSSQKFFICFVVPKVHGILSDHCSKQAF